MKPFIETLRVTNPVRQSRASSRKRVLRGEGRLSLRSVDSEIKRCVIEPRNFLVVSPRRCQTRGPSQALAYTWTHQRAWSHRGRRNMANDQVGFSGNLGDLAVSIVTAGWSPAYQLQVDPRLPSRAGGDEQGTKRWYRQAKETKCGEMGGKESERLVVPLSQGNHPRDPGEGRGRRLMNRWRETCQVRRDLSPCPRNDNGSRNSPGTALTWLSRT